MPSKPSKPRKAPPKAAPTAAADLKKPPIKGAHGGTRAGAGRKPDLTRALRDGYLKDKQAEAEYAYALMAATMRDGYLDVAVRLDAAREVMNRTWGKPRQAVELSGGDTPVKWYLTSPGFQGPTSL
jgi:hypothetical protein